MDNLLTVTIVTYNNEENIEVCINSLLKSSLVKEIIIVDNNSFDDTVLKIKDNSSKKIKLIESKVNLGFGKAHNLAVSRSEGEYLLILNPDTKALDSSIEKLMTFIISNPETGLVAPKLIQEDGSAQASARKFPTLWGAIKEYFFKEKHAYTQYVPKGDSPIEVDVVYGAAMLIKKELFKKIGEFDEKFYLYYEDLDLCRRIKQAGFKIYYLKEAEFLHLVGRSFRSVDKKKLPIFISTLANFFPIRSSGTTYHQVRSSNVYHGFLSAFLIRLIIYTSQKLKISS